MAQGPRSTRAQDSTRTTAAPTAFTTPQPFSPGGHSGVVPPDPFPNSVVKRACADDSVGPPHVKVGHRQAPIPDTPIHSWIGVSSFRSIETPAAIESAIQSRSGVSPAAGESAQTRQRRRAFCPSSRAFPANGAGLDAELPQPAIKNRLPLAGAGFHFSPGR